MRHQVVMGVSWPQSLSLIEVSDKRNCGGGRKGTPMRKLEARIITGGWFKVVLSS